MRVRVYVDGFNVYYRALKKTSYKWLNPLALAQSLLDPVDTIDVLRYFTARVSSRAGDPGAPARQQAYLSALTTIPEIKVHYGRFLAQRKWRPTTADPTKYVEIHDSEEKGSDANLASFLLHDGWGDKYDAALVMSQDTDLCEPLRMVRKDLDKSVGLVWLDGQQPGRRFRNCVSFVRHATPSRLKAAQFPEELRNRKGDLVSKPASW